MNSIDAGLREVFTPVLNLADYSLEKYTQE
jgi:hypothetical protein